MLTITAGVLLLITGSAKMFTGMSRTAILDTADPIFLIPLRFLLLPLAFIEIAIAFLCFSKRCPIIQSTLIAWLASCFLFYRLSLSLIDYHRPCPCLGELTESLHIPTYVADNCTKGAMVYLLLLGYGRLWVLRNPKLRIAGDADLAPHGPLP